MENIKNQSGNKRKKFTETNFTVNSSLMFHSSKIFLLENFVF